MNSNPLVSVIIPSYNHECYIEQAINSVINQTYKNIELIVIDDGSTDNSLTLLSELSVKLGFKFVAQENMGVCKTLNRGIREFSRGQLICILASDDRFHSTKIELQVKELSNNKSSEFCFTQAVEFDTNSGKELRVFPKKNFTGRVLNKIIFRQPYAAGSIMFTRDLYNDIDGFDPSLKAEDWDFSIRCAAKTDFSFVSKPLFYYRSHANNTMKAMSRRDIFHNKAIILAKNYMLVSPWLWMFSVLSHFLYDHFYSLLKRLKIRQLVN
ncbi:glycosyltransferase [Thalassolituus oleivorans]|uniref:glycosyltransferase n=1 Tax=Thalassolituus oleivorans TaxID=187493 RepID=UPI00042DC650|nr:glycosyltransferase [Thalassolituus oleivorans]AHK15511.1 glycosyl transferase [Thalassolituus oleivorans R6-15]